MDPDSLAEAKEQGATDPDLLKAVYCYRESPYRHPNSSIRLLFRSNAYLIGFDAFNLVPELLTQPLQVIVAGGRGATGQYEDGERLFILSPATEKYSSSLKCRPLRYALCPRLCGSGH
ncbi:hypothetical protein [Phyllobacterium endophyticum]|uniref:hypothetical protein n=1 Tax=Phyllobacterium endophyticum TaxID=1149773 RepID=UPI00183A9E96|nr:hypothetical protein [Phyllobacterium endophyticum]MBB3236901.1 hypothetical protein [Phyllobacterium endophyticum]